MNLVSSIASHAYDAALALVYPQACAVCGGSVETRHDGVACAACWEATRVFSAEDVLCWKCGAASRANVAQDKRREVRCGQCDTDAFDVARACGSYEGALRASILELKRQPHIPRRLTRLLHQVWQRDPLNSADVIVPVPLHESRERERGFNQALIVARALSRFSGLRLDEHSIFRRSHTERHRAGMDAKARRESVAGAFEVRQPDLIKDRRVLLIDDVFTTGATVSACASAMKDVGAKEVFVLTLARA